MHFPNRATKITTFTVFVKLKTNVLRNICSMLSYTSFGGRKILALSHNYK